MQNRRRARSMTLCGIPLAILIVAVSMSSASSKGMADAASLALASERGISQCMSVAGFRYVPTVTLDALIEEAKSRAIDDGDDPAQAAEALMANPPTDPNVAIRGRLSTGRQRAYDVAFHNCREQQVASDNRAALEAMALEQERLGLPPDLPAYVEARPTVKEATQVYLRCLATQGYPSVSRQDFLQKYGPDTQRTPLAVDKAMATEDQCYRPVELAYNEQYLLIVQAAQAGSDS